MLVMAALCHRETRCLVAFECREAALRTQLLAAAHQRFGKVGWVSCTCLTPFLHTPRTGCALAGGPVLMQSCVHAAALTAGRMQVSQVPLACLPWDELCSADWVEVYQLLEPLSAGHSVAREHERTQPQTARTSC